MEALPELPEGVELLNAITNVRQYESDNPNWFSEKFGVSTPIMTPLTSISPSDTDSGHGSLSPILSVSSQDIAASDVGSPTSVFGQQPDYSAYLKRNTSTRSNPDRLPVAGQRWPFERGCGSQRSRLKPKELVSQEYMPPQKNHDPSMVTVATGGNTMATVGEASSEICPPDVVSDVGTDVMSGFLQNINCRGDWGRPPLGNESKYLEKQNSVDHPFDHGNVRPPVEIGSIRPPQPCSDVSSECVSLALRQVNADTDQAFKDQGEGHDLTKVGVDLNEPRGGISGLQEPDSISL